MNFGSKRMRPMANQVRVVALAPAFALATAELMMAMKTSTQPTPQAALAR